MSTSSTSFTRAWCSISDEDPMKRSTKSLCRGIAAFAVTVLLLAPAADAARQRGSGRDARPATERRARGLRPYDPDTCIGHIDGICIEGPAHPGDAPLSLAPITRPDVGAAPRRLLVVLDARAGSDAAASERPSTRPADVAAAPSTRPSLTASAAPQDIDAAHRQALTVLSRRVPLPLAVGEQP